MTWTPWLREVAVRIAKPPATPGPPRPFGATLSRKMTWPEALLPSPLIAEIVAVSVTVVPYGMLVAFAEMVTAVLAYGLGSATWRTRFPCNSETNSAPDAETANPAGRSSGAWVASTPLTTPQHPRAEPLPARVQIKPEDMSSMRTR